MTTSLALLVMASSGYGQVWLLHAHAERPWHAHTIDPSGGVGPVRGGSCSDDGHEHDDSLPLDPSDEGMVIVVKSGPAMAACGHGAAQSGPGSLFSTVPPVIATTPSSITADARPPQRCAPMTTASRAVESLLRSNHALLI